jgi:hypothetical protein
MWCCGPPSITAPEVAIWEASGAVQANISCETPFRGIGQPGCHRPQGKRLLAPSSWSAYRGLSVDGASSGAHTKCSPSRKDPYHSTAFVARRHRSLRPRPRLAADRHCRRRPAQNSCTSTTSLAAPSVPRNASQGLVLRRRDPPHTGAASRVERRAAPSVIIPRP